MCIFYAHPYTCTPLQGTGCDHCDSVTRCMFPSLSIEQLRSKERLVVSGYIRSFTSKQKEEQLRKHVIIPKDIVNLIYKHSTPFIIQTSDAMKLSDYMYCKRSDSFLDRFKEWQPKNNTEEGI